MNEEIWKDIPNYEGFYQVSNTGKVRSLDRVVYGKNNTKRNIKGVTLAGSENGRGYLILRLCKCNQSVGFKIHRLVCMMFQDNPKNKPEVNHINEVKTDNRLENLEWCTRIENMNHGSIPVAVNQYSLQGVLIKKWRSIADANRSGFIKSCISNACKGKRKTHLGFKWKYAK